jgi:hypothetical protein
MIHTQGKLKVGAVSHTGQYAEIDAVSNTAWQGAYPWERLALCYGDEDYPDQGSKIMEANARRLVACWNACEGISTAALEGKADDILEYNITLLHQRDELKAALKVMLRGYAAVHDIGDVEMQPAIDQAIAAIKKVEQS